jgi:Stage II sporulation protein E (SpoIIE)
MRRFLFSVLLVFTPLQSYSQSVHTPVAPSAPPAPANTTQVSVGQSVIALNGPWKFRVGDDPSWAAPNYDDSLWENMDLTPKTGSFDPITGWSGYVPGWTATGHPDYWGYAWYRIRVQVDARPGQKFAVSGPSNVDDVYQVFANGTLLGSFGKFPEGQTPTEYYSQPMMFQLPQAQAQGPQVVVLAFRVWMEPDTLLKAPDAGGFHDAPLIGDTAAITANYQLARLALDRTYLFAAITAGLFFLLAIMSGSLILFDRSDPVYRWLTVVFLLTAVERVAACLASWTQVESIVASTVIQDVLAGPLILGGWVMVWWVWFRLRHLSWMPKVIAVLTMLYMFCDLLGEDLFFTVISHPVSALFHLASVGIRILFLLPLVFIVIEGVNKQGWEGLLALPAVTLVVIGQFQTELSVMHFHTNWFPLGLQVTIAEIAYLTLAGVIFVLLLRRLYLSLQRQQELASDVKQAQEVQQVLIPEKLPQLPGIAIESEYRPAREVGGDFFQIVPHPTDGSVLVVAGDVTGKGLQAGMLGALIVGAIRTEAAHSNNPVTVLRALNDQLFERGHAHATCLALRISRSGAGILANAGHLPPYLNGKELPIEGSLPLGMIPKSDLSQLTFQLQPGDCLMLLSDGVAEAQNEHGRLFGFDAIRQLLARPISAADIANAAQTFGQQDDISVLSISRTVIPGEAIVWRTAAL